MDEINARKAALRAQAKLRRTAMSADERAAKSAAMCALALALPAAGKTARVLCYLSLPQEPDTRAIVRAALARGKALYVPRVLPERGLAFHRIFAEDEAAPGAFGIREPPADAPLFAGGDALCFVPGLCFDAGGCRVGYGGGYYDRFLAAFAGIAAGLCFEADLAPSLPRTQTDRAVGIVVTEKRAIYGNGAV